MVDSPFLLQIIVGGLVAVDLSADPYGVNPASLEGFGEPEVEAVYGETGGHGSTLTARRFRNRVIGLDLGIYFESGGTNAREKARNAIAEAFDKARRYQMRATETLGVKDTAGEVLLKFRPPNATQAFYCRILDGSIGTSPFFSTAGAVGSANGKAYDDGIPVTIITEPLWHFERDLYLRNVLINGGFEAGYSAGVPFGWTRTDSANTTGSAVDESASFVRSGLSSVRLGFTDTTGAGEDAIYQTVTLADVGLSVGQTVSLSANVYIYERTGSAIARLILQFLDATNVIIGTHVAPNVSTVGSWQTPRVTRDIPTGCDKIRVHLTVNGPVAGAGAITAFWDNAQVQPHVDNLLLTGDFESDRDGNGVADNWVLSSSGTAAVGNSLSTTVKYDSRSQSLARTGGNGDVVATQDVSLASRSLQPGDVLTAAIWCQLTGADAGTSAHLSLRFLDGNGRRIHGVQSAPLTAINTWTYLSASGVVPVGATTASVRLVLPSTNSVSAIYSLWDWATLYEGHHDGSGGRLWPYASEWTDSSRLNLDYDNPNGRWMVMSHSGLRGNVPGPARLLVGLPHSAPETCLIAYKRGNPNVIQYDTDAGTAVATLGVGATVGMIGGTSRRWTPSNTVETPLMTWTVRDIAPGRYLLAIGLSVSHVGRFKFRAGARAYSGAAVNAGVWNPNMTPPPPWESAATRQIWPLGVLELPPMNRMGSHINDFVIELLGRCTDVAGAPTADLDFLYLFPQDGFAQVQPSKNATAVTTAGVPNRGILELDSIRDFLPIFTLGPGNGTATLTRLTGIQDVGEMASATRFHLGAEGLFVIAHLAAAGFDPTYPVNLGLFYRPCFTTPAGV